MFSIANKWWDKPCLLNLLAIANIDKVRNHNIRVQMDFGAATSIRKDLLYDDSSLP